MSPPMDIGDQGSAPTWRAIALRGATRRERTRPCGARWAGDSRLPCAGHAAQTTLLLITNLRKPDACSRWAPKNLPWAARTWSAAMSSKGPGLPLSSKHVEIKGADPHNEPPPSRKRSPGCKAPSTSLPGLSYRPRRPSRRIGPCMVDPGCPQCHG